MAIEILEQTTYIFFAFIKHVLFCKTLPDIFWHQVHLGGSALIENGQVSVSHKQLLHSCDN